jgi:hypothetical protein
MTELRAALGALSVGFIVLGFYVAIEGSADKLGHHDLVVLALLLTLFGAAAVCLRLVAWLYDLERRNR